MLQKAQTAKEANEEATALEKIKVEVAGSYGLDGKIDKEQLNTNLKGIDGLTYNGYEIDLADQNKKITKLPSTVKLNGYAYTILENGSVDKVAWINNNNGSYTNVKTNQTLTVGDTVKYETILENNELDSDKKDELITSLGTYSGNTDSSKNTDSSIVRDSLAWKVLDVKDGEIRLISAVPTTSKIRLYNADGYNNAVYLIDKACDTLYSVNGVGRAQNLKIEDIESTLTYNYKNYTNTDVTPNVKYEETKEYNSRINYPNIYPSEIGCKAISTEDNVGETSRLGMSNQAIPVIGSSLATNRLKVTQTFWNKTITISDFNDSKYYSLFIKETNYYPEYWLSSRCVNCGPVSVFFYVNYVNSNGVGGYYMFCSNGGISGRDYAFRPVVTLEANIQLEQDGVNTWKIK